MRVRSISGSFEGGCGEGGRDGWPRGETPGDSAKGDFLEGTRSPRPQIRAGRKPGEVIATHGSARGRWPKGGQYWVWRNAFLAGVRSPPLRRVDDPS